MGKKLKLSFENQVPPRFFCHNKMVSYLVTLALTLPCPVSGMGGAEDEISHSSVSLGSLLLNYATKSPGCIDCLKY